MNTPIREKILQEIRTHRQGWAFSATDFIQTYKRGDIDVALASLAETGAIRRVARGIYDYPMYSSILNKFVAPDMFQIAKAIARKHNWNIFPDGNTALNYLGLSTQIVAKHIYLSDGPTKKYTIENTTIEFKHLSKKDAITNDKNTTLVIQAIRAMGEQQITENFIEKLSAKFSMEEWDSIRNNAHRSAEWIYSIIKKAANLAKEKNNG